MAVSAIRRSASARLAMRAENVVRSFFSTANETRTNRLAMKVIPTTMNMPSENAKTTNRDNT